SFRGSIVRSVNVASSPQQGSGVAQLAARFENVHPVLGHAASTLCSTAYGDDMGAIRAYRRRLRQIHRDPRHGLTLDRPIHSALSPTQLPRSTLTGLEVIGLSF